MKDVLVPDIGDFKDVEVIEVLVGPGDRISPEQALIVLESDKATIEVPSPVSGVVRELRVKRGDRLSQGALILHLEDESSRDRTSSAPAAPATRKVVEPSAPATGNAHPVAAIPAMALANAGVAKSLEAGLYPMEEIELVAAKATGTHAGPAVRRLARELGVDIGQVKGSGPRGRVLRDDVQRFVKQIVQVPAANEKRTSNEFGFDLPAWPQIDFSGFGPVETVALSRVQKISGPVLHRNWVSIPHVTQFDEADITDLEAFRKAHQEQAAHRGTKLTMLAFLVKACVAALRAFPQFNASLAAGGGELVLKRYYHIGVAVDTPDGLLVPVLRDADRKGIIDIAVGLNRLSTQARERKIQPADMKGGTFSISSLGGIGGVAFTPIINAPEVAILGASRASVRPVWNGEQFVPRLMLPLSLSYDHRAIDGALGARFITHLAGVLSDLRRSVL